MTTYHRFCSGVKVKLFDWLTRCVSLLPCKVFLVIAKEWFPDFRLKLDWLSCLTVGEVNSLSEVDVTSLRSLSRGIFSLPTSFVKGESGPWHKNHQIQFMKSPILVPLFYPCIFFSFCRERIFYSGLYKSLHTTNLLVLRI